MRPDFVKAVLDGVPMTRTSSFLDPYKPDPFGPGGGASGCRCPFHGSGLFTTTTWAGCCGGCLTRAERQAARHRGGTVRQALDAIRLMRERHGDGPVFHVAHPEFAHPGTGKTRVTVTITPMAAGVRHRKRSLTRRRRSVARRHDRKGESVVRRS